MALSVRGSPPRVVTGPMRFALADCDADEQRKPVSRQPNVQTSMSDDEEPRADDRTARRPAAGRGRWRAGCRRRRGTVLRLKEIRDVAHRIDSDRLRAAHR